MIAVAAEGDGPRIGRIRMRRILDASAACFAFSRIPSSRAALSIPMAGLPAPGRQAISARDHIPEGKQQNRIGTNAASPLRRRTGQTLAARNLPGRREYGTPGCLSRRVHVPIQSMQIAQSGQVVLPPFGTRVAVELAPCKSLVKGSTTRTSEITRSWGYLSHVNTHLVANHPR